MTVYSRIIEVQRKLQQERQEELLRALDFQASCEWIQAAYHTGLADGRNGVCRTLTDILNNESLKE